MMPNYRVLVEVRNLPARLLEGAKSPVGFYATRFVHADGEAAAGQAAIETLKEEFLPLFGERMADEWQAMAHIAELEKVETIPDHAPSAGAVWFVMDD